MNTHKESKISGLGFFFVASLLSLMSCASKEEPSEPEGDGEGGSGGGGVVLGEGYDCSAPEGALPPLRLEEVASGFSRPVLVTHAPADERLFVVEQDGLVWIVEDGVVSAEPFLDIEERVASPLDDAGGERGLLGLAFHPAFQENGLLYVHYSARAGETEFPEGDTVLSEFRVDFEVPDVVDSGTERVVLTEMQPASNHNGGSVIFGPDGMLYLALGDGGGGNDQFGHGQNLTTLKGSIVRIDPDGRGAGEYGIPEGNVDQGGLLDAPEIWSYGLRNPYRINFDACTGDLYIGDVGQNTTEEIDVIKAGDGRLNFGWPIMEGSSCTAGDSCDSAGLTPPVAEYPTGDGGAVTGGSVYRGREIPALRGAYLFADSSQGRAFWARFDRDTGEMSAPLEITDEFNQGAIVSIQNGPDGELYVTSLFPGTLFKVTSQ